MQPIKLEIFLDDKTLAGMKSVEGNIAAMESVTKQMIDHLKLQLKDLEAQYKVLQKQGLAGDRELADIQAMQGAIGGLKDQLKELQKAKQQANETPVIDTESVKRQTNSLKMQFSQVARELPSLAMGPQMFILAISNNLPYLADAIKNVREQNELLAKSNQKGIPVWKQLLSAAGSWQTMLVIGITLLTVYGKEIWEWTKGLFKAKDATLELLTAEQEMAQARSKVSDSIKKEQAELDILYAKLKTTVASTKERTAAVNEWQKRYPEYANILNGENINLGKLESAYKALSKEIYATAVAKHYMSKIEDLSIKKDKEEIKRLNQKATLSRAQNAYNLALDNYNKSTGQAKNGASVILGRSKENLEKQQQIYDELINNVKTYDDNITTIENHIKTLDLFPQPQEGTYDYWTQQKERAEGVLKEIKSSVKKALDDASANNKDLFSLGIDKSVVDTYKRATNELKQAQKELKVYDTKEKKTTGKPLSDYENELADARIRAQQKVEAARIAVMVEGREKRKAIARKEYDETIAAIDKEERDTLAKLEKSKKAGKKVTPEEEQQVKDSATSQRTIAMAQHMQAAYAIEKEWRDKNRQAWIDYNKEYGTYQEKRLAIAQDYALRIGRAETEGEKASLKRERDNKLKEHDFNNFKTSINFADVFGNLDEQSTDALSVLRDKLKEYINGAAKDLRPSDLKELQDALTQIDLKLDDRAPFKELKKSLADYQGAQAAVSKAQEELNTVMKGGEIITEVYRDETGKLVTKLLTQEQAEKNLSDAQSKRLQKQTALAKSLTAVGSEMSSYGQAADTIISTLESFGVKVDENVKGIVEGFNTMSDGISQFAQSLLTMDIGGMISGVVNTVGGVLKSVGSLFGADWGGERSRRRYEEAKQKYQDYMDVLDKVISKQKDLVASMESDDFANADNSYERARQLLKKQQDYAREMGKAYLNSGASKGFLGIGSKASEGTKQRENISSSAWAQAKKVLGGDYNKISDGRMTGLFDLSYEQLVKLRDEASGFWSELHKDTQDYLNQIIESEEAWKEVQEARKEALTKTDFDNFYNNFISMLSDMDATSEDFANSFEKYLQNAIFSALVATKYKDRIQKLYDSWADMAESDSKLSGTEADKLRDDYQKIIDEMLKEREQLMKDFNWEPSGEDGSSQSGRSGAFATLTQEQGTKLEGLFTSLQDHTSGIHKLLNDLMKGRESDTEIFMQIAENTAYCKFLELMYEIMERQDREGVKMK